MDGSWDGRREGMEPTCLVIQHGEGDDELQKLSWILSAARCRSSNHGGAEL